MKNIPCEDFWNLVVKPTIDEFLENPNSFQRTVLAVWSLDSMVSHMSYENKYNPNSLNEVDFKNKLAVEVKTFNSIREASNSLKHAVRNSNSQTEGSNSIEIRERGWGEAEWGVDEFGGTPIPLVNFKTGSSSSLKYSIDDFSSWIQIKIFS
ncbi:hypothetical protein AOC19_06180 [Polynucleobacter asymbioticus]|uniref:hypothetical protein n=1 Tax=Polynucleobacter asymbioticus TaxID=576611 RepID=UPI001BFDD01A|nr:hypothetical protein [Polynucleobacter asymbioticus]QWD84752.1 hypothetical protein AOC19_06180 [Polynucleobacter asymbioticus]